MRVASGYLELNIDRRATGAEEVLLPPPSFGLSSEPEPFLLDDVLSSVPVCFVQAVATIIGTSITKNSFFINQVLNDTDWSRQPNGM